MGVHRLRNTRPYYNRSTYETRDMNWFGPYNGNYFEEMMVGLLNKIDTP